MNRQFCQSMVFVFLLAMVSQVQARSETILEVGDYFGAASDTISIDIMLTNPNRAVAGLQFDLTWDDHYLNYLGVENTARAGGWSLAEWQHGTDTIRVLAYDLSGTRIATGSGAILRVHFLPTDCKSFPRIKLTAEQVRLADDNGAPVAVSSRSGEIILANDQQSVRISDGSAEPGQNDTLAVVLDHLEAVSAFEMLIRDQPNHLRGVGILPGNRFDEEDLADWQISGSESDEGGYTILGFTTGSQYLTAGSDTLCQVIYAVDSDAAFTDVNLEFANLNVLDTLGNGLGLESGNASFRIGAPPVWIDAPADTLEFGTALSLDVVIENREALRYFQIEIADTAALFELDSAGFSVADWELLVLEPDKGKYQIVAYSPIQQLIPAHSRSVLTLAISPPDSGRESWYGLTLAESVFRDSLDRQLAVNSSTIELAMMNPLQTPLWTAPPNGQHLALNLDWLSGEELFFSWRPAGAVNFLTVDYTLQMQVESGNYSLVQTVVNDTAVAIDLAGLLQDFADQGLAYPVDFDLVSTLEAHKGGRDISAVDSVRLHFAIATAIDQRSQTAANEFRLHPIAPNPFNSAATIRFALAREEAVEIVVLDIRGQQVATLLSERLPAGEHRLQWQGLDQNGMPAKSGLYFCVLRAGASRLVRKMILLR